MYNSATIRTLINHGLRINPYKNHPPNNHNNHINQINQWFRHFILLCRFVLTNQNQLIMENFNHQGIWEYAVKRIADPMLKTEDCNRRSAKLNLQQPLQTY